MEDSSHMQSFVMMFQQQTEDIFIKWVASESKKWTSEQTVAFLERSLSDYDRKQQECVYDDARLMASQKSYTDYMEGRCYVHAHDYYLLNVLAVLLNTQEEAQCIAVCKKHPSVFTTLLNNSIRCLCCIHACQALGFERYRKWHESIVYYDVVLTSRFTIVDFYLYAIQLALRVLDPDQVVLDIIAFHANDLRLGLGENNEDKSVGKEWMLSYCVFTILSVLFTQNVFRLDNQVPLFLLAHP